MHLPIHACTQLPMHPPVHTCIHPYTHPSVHACIQLCTHPFIHACTQPRTHPSMHARIHPCIHSSIHACVHACMHACIHAQATHALLYPCMDTSFHSPAHLPTCSFAYLFTQCSFILSSSVSFSHVLLRDVFKFSVRGHWADLSLRSLWSFNTFKVKALPCFTTHSDAGANRSSWELSSP